MLPHTYEPGRNFETKITSISKEYILLKRLESEDLYKRIKDLKCE